MIGTPVFDVVLERLRTTGELPRLGQSVEASFKIVLHSGGGCSPDVFAMQWANESMGILGIDPEVADAWDQHGGPQTAVEESINSREDDIIRFLRLFAGHLENRELARLFQGDSFPPGDENANESG